MPGPMTTFCNTLVFERYIRIVDAVENHGGGSCGR